MMRYDIGKLSDHDYSTSICYMEIVFEKFNKSG